MREPKQPAAEPTPKPPPTPAAEKPVPEVGGRRGPDPTRYGDYEKDGRCIDF